MKRQTTSAAWTMVGAVIGAGFASGREIAAFFSRWGAWSILAVAGASLVLAGLAYGAMVHPGPPGVWLDGWREKLWKLLFVSLLTATGGAMLAAAGEIAALVLPWRGAREMGRVLSLLLAVFLAGKDTPWLAHLSKALTVCLTAALLTGVFIEPMRGIALDASSCWIRPLGSLLSGICYGGFNAALASPVLGDAARGLNVNEKRRAAFQGCVLLTLLLLGGNAVLLRQPALQGESMPLVVLTAQLGRIGYALGASMLYLAVMTTLLACLRGACGLTGRRWPSAAMLLVSLLGFSGAVDALYPALGGACFVLLAAANFRNWSNGAFHSGKPMI